MNEQNILSIIKKWKKFCSDIIADKKNETIIHRGYNLALTILLEIENEINGNYSNVEPKIEYDGCNNNNL